MSQALLVEKVNYPDFPAIVTAARELGWIKVGDSGEGRNMTVRWAFMHQGEARFAHCTPSDPRSTCTVYVHEMSPDYTYRVDVTTLVRDAVNLVLDANSRDVKHAGIEAELRYCARRLVRAATIIALDSVTLNPD